jgi:hypothetical protein
MMPDTDVMALAKALGHRCLFEGGQIVFNGLFAEVHELCVVCGARRRLPVMEEKIIIELERLKKLRGWT